MFDKNDKRRLYQLIDMYLQGNITAKVFCDEYYYSYDLEINSDTFTDKEQAAFMELSVVTDRFSEFEEDHKKYPNGFFTEEELRSKIIETKERLKS